MANETPEQQKIAQLEKELKTAQDGKAKAEGDLQKALTVIEDLEGKLAEHEASKPQLPVFTYNKEQYVLESAFLWKGQEVTIDVLKENTKLVKELLEEKVSLIKKVTKE